MLFVSLSLQSVYSLLKRPAVMGTHCLPYGSRSHSEPISQVVSSESPALAQAGLHSLRFVEYLGSFIIYSRAIVRALYCTARCCMLYVSPRLHSEKGASTCCNLPFTPAAAICRICTISCTVTRHVNGIGILFHRLDFQKDQRV